MRKTGHERHSYGAELQMEGCFAEGKRHTGVDVVAAVAAVAAAAGYELEYHCVTEAVAVAAGAVEVEVVDIAAVAVADC